MQCHAWNDDLIHDEKFQRKPSESSAMTKVARAPVNKRVNTDTLKDKYYIISRLKISDERGRKWRAD